MHLSNLFPKYTQLLNNTWSQASFHQITLDIVSKRDIQQQTAYNAMSYSRENNEVSASGEDMVNAMRGYKA